MLNELYVIFCLILQRS